jgi:hypothetical protein
MADWSEGNRVPARRRLCCSPTATCLITFPPGRDTSVAVWQFSSLPWPNLPCRPVVVSTQVLVRKSSELKGGGRDCERL